jgi:formylglycine-generating enzyme required for sulfatase activity
MVEIPAGELVMGENAGDKFANDTERPAHCVNLSKDFAVGSAPVTVGEFRHFDVFHAIGEMDELPVVRVSWRAALDYCNWLSDRTSRSYRLPSESEWEYACRAGSRGPFACGDEISPELANYFYDESGIRVGLGRRTPVGSYPANAFGLYDLHGNVCEWVADAWHPDYHGAPADGRPWTDAIHGQRRVIRGGAWDYLPRLLRSAWRDWRPADFRADNIGFRVVTDDLKQRNS